MKAVSSPRGNGRKSPLYAVVADTLRDRIMGGMHPVGSRLPTEMELAEQFSVGRHTVREAIRMLREAQLVAPRQGFGTVVLPHTGVASFNLEGQSINDLIEQASDIRIEVEATAIEPIDADEAKRIGLPFAGDWMVMRGMVVASKDSAAVCSSTHYINCAYASIVRLIPRLTGPVFLRLEEVFGIRITVMEQDIFAADIRPAEASRLEVAVGSPAIQVRRIFRTDDDVVQVTVNNHPAAKFHYHAELRRTGI